MRHISNTSVFYWISHCTGGCHIERRIHPIAEENVRTSFPISKVSRTLLVGLAFTLLSTVAGASTIIVDGTVCTLGEAISAANANVAYGGCRAGNDHNGGGDIIDLRVDVLLTTSDNTDTDGCPNGLPRVFSKIHIEGNDHTIARDVVNGAPSFRVLDAPKGHLILSHVTIKNGQGESCDGGGIKGGTVTLNDSTVSNNTVYLANGGGIAARVLTLNRSTLSDNMGGGAYVSGAAVLNYATVTRNTGFSDYSGGGLDVRGILALNHSTVSDNQGGGTWAIGGGLYVDGTVAMNSSTVSGNIAGGDVGVGGGLFLYRGAAIIINSTISGNTAQGGSTGVNYAGSGGGIFSTGMDPIYTGPGGTVTLVHSTVSNNSAIGPYSPPGYVGGTGGGILSDVLTLTNTIVAGNVATNPNAGDCSATTIRYTGLNLVGDGSCSASSFAQLTGTAMLLPLGNYGGATMTQPPRPGSPVIDRIATTAGGRCSFARAIRTDQRDGARPNPAGAGCDIGAVEYSKRLLTITAAPETSSIWSDRLLNR